MNHEPTKSEIALLISQEIMNKMKDKNLLFDEHGVNVSIRGEVRSGMSFASIALIVFSEKISDMIMDREKVEDRIFNKIKREWEKIVGKGNVDTSILRKIIRISNTDDDGKKRITLMSTGKTYLIPIEAIILEGIRGCDLNKYPTVNQRRSPTKR